MDLKRLLSSARRFKKISQNTDTIDKSAIVSGIKTALINASTYSRQTGIKPFIEMLKNDAATLSATFTRNGSTTTVSNLTVSKPELLSHYQDLAEQFGTYLTKYWELYPTKSGGDNIKYSNFVFQIQFP